MIQSNQRLPPGPLAKPATPLATELPARAEPPSPPVTETPPPKDVKSKGVLAPKALFDETYRHARNYFTQIPDMTFALAMAGHALRKSWDFKDGKFIRKELPFANYVPPRRGEHEQTHTPPRTSTKVAEARARWDEAKREGNPGRMTRTATEVLAPRSAPTEPAVAAGIALGSGAANAATVQDEDADAGIGWAPVAGSFNHGAVALESDTQDHDPSADQPLQPVAHVTPDGAIAGAVVAKPGERHWTPIQRANAAALQQSLAPVGAAIQKHGTPEQRAAWRLISKFSLQPTRVRTGAAADYAGGVFSVDLNQVGARLDPNDPRRVMPPDPNYVNFMIVHEVFHATASNQDAMREAYERQGRRWQRGAPTIGSAQWSVEVRHDKMVYDFLVEAGLLPVPPPPIERIAPYYAEHLANPRVPVHTFRVPGYDGPL